ncbi:MAG: hypothetical protein K5669_01990 [Lachnospiraceae bacterium]|nr:hypothetical protein [Lachnospiraceae bacterium]
MKYITSQLRKGHGGRVLFEKAMIKKNGLSVILGCVCLLYGREEETILLSMGEWFQNTVVEEVISNGICGDEDECTALLCKLFDSPFIQEMGEISDEGKISFFLGVGEYVILTGRNTFVFQKEFGIQKFIPASAYGEQVISLAENSAVFIKDGNFIDLSDYDIKKCLSEADSDERALRALDEISADQTDAGLIFVKVV